MGQTKFEWPHMSDHRNLNECKCDVLSMRALCAYMQSSLGRMLPLVESSDAQWAWETNMVRRLFPFNFFSFKFCLCYVILPVEGSRWLWISPPLRVIWLFTVHLEDQKGLLAVRHSLVLWCSLATLTVGGHIENFSFKTPGIRREQWYHNKWLHQDNLVLCLLSDVSPGHFNSPPWLFAFEKSYF